MRLNWGVVCRRNELDVFFMRSISFWPRFVCVCVCVLRIQAVEPSETRHATLRSRSRRKRIALMVASVVSFTGSDRVSTTGEFRYADNERTNDRTNERTNGRTEKKGTKGRKKREREKEKKRVRPWAVYTALRPRKDESQKENSRTRVNIKQKKGERVWY